MSTTKTDTPLEGEIVTTGAELATAAAPGAMAQRRAEMTKALTQVFEEAGWRADDGTDPEAALLSALDIALRIATAETVEEVLDPGQTISGKDLVGYVLKITDPTAVTLRRSTFEGGVGFYMQFPAEVTNPKTGETRAELVSVGALNVMVQLARLCTMGALDRPFRIVEGDETTRGFKPLWLAAV